MPNCIEIPPAPLWTQLTDQGFAEMYMGVQSGGNVIKSQSQYTSIYNAQYRGRMWTTKKGHVIFIGDETDVQFQQICKNELMPNMVRFAMSRGSMGSYGRDIDNAFTGAGWPVRFAWKMFQNPSVVSGFRDSKTQNGITYWNIWDLITKIETSGFPTNKPIAITWSDQDIITVRDIAKAVAGFLSLPGVKELICAAALVFGANPAMVYAALTAVQKFLESVATGQIPTTELIQIAGNVIQPELSGKVQQGYDVLQLVQQGKFEEAAQKLGVNTSSIKGVLNTVIGGQGASIVDNLLPGKQLDNVRDTLSVVGSADLIQKALQYKKQGKFDQLINSSNFISDPVVQNALIATTGDTVPSVIPGIEDIAKGLINTTKSYVSSPAEWCNIINMGSGFDLPTNGIANISLEAMTNQAIQAAKQNREYVVPGAVKKENRNCVADELRKRTGGKIITGNVVGKTKTLPTTKQPTQKKTEKRLEWL